MKTEGNDENIRHFESGGSEDLLGNSFISYINILSDSIKEYYKISIDIIENKMVLFNKIQSEIYSSIPSMHQKKFPDLLKNLKVNIELSKINLYNFFDDAKILFKKMKDYQNSFKNKIPKNPNHLLKSQDRRIIGNNSAYQNSEINNKIKIDPDKNFSFGDNIIFGSNQKEKPKSVKIKSAKTYNNYNNSQLIQENEKLKKLNKTYEIDIKKLNMELEKIKKSKSNNSLKNNDNSLNKDSVISSLKIKSEEVNKKNELLIKKIKLIQMENKSLKEKSNKLNKFILSNKYLINKFNNDIQKNNALKSNIDSFNSCKIDLPDDSYYKLKTNINNFDSCKVSFPYDSYYKYTSKSPNLNRNNTNKSAYNEHLKIENSENNRNELIEKRLKEVEKKNQILKEENDKIINKYESELLKLINRNKELSKNSIQLQKKLVILQRENLDKSKEIEKLTKITEDNEQHQKLSVLMSDKEINNNY